MNEMVLEWVTFDDNKMKEQGLFHDETEQHLQDMKSGATAMLVTVRVRPLTPKEIAIDPSETVKVFDSKMIVLADSGEQGEKRSRSRQAKFCFDFVYSASVSTKQIYDQSLSGMLDGILEGYNSTILAYGATGCGKTYTMIGEGGKEGISALTMIDLLGRANQMRRYKNIVIRVAYIQIYNEIIKDLLISQDKNLQLREDPKEGIQIPGVTEIAITSLLELATVLKVGAANRSKEATSSNEASSRSHSLLLVKTESRDKAQGLREETSIGKLSLVDLAGSERAGGQKGARQIEGAKINKSLLALGNCIQVLADSSSKAVFVPYRQSKLTRLLKESLGGNCRTALIVNVSPFSGSWEDTYNSLLYGNRAKNIKTTAARNVLATEAHLNNYMALIANLKRENEELKKNLRTNKNNSLPQLKSLSAAEESDRLDMLRIQNKVDSHFVNQLKLLKVISELQLQLDKSAFKLYRLQLQRKEEKGKRMKGDKGQRNEEKLSKSIEEVSQQKQDFETKLEELVLERGTLMAEIKSSDLTQSNIAFLTSHYRQKKVEVQLQEVRLRESRLESERQQKEQLMGLLGQQLKIRDKIIEEQRIIIQKNNIINRITYSKIGSLNNSQFPDIFQTLQHAQLSILPQQKSENLSLFHEKSMNKERLTEEASLKHSLSKRKLNKASMNQLAMEQSQQQSSERIVISESELQEGKRSMVGKGKIVRNKSRKKKGQLDLVYMQR